MCGLNPLNSTSQGQAAVCLLSVCINLVASRSAVVCEWPKPTAIQEFGLRLQPHSAAAC